MGGTAASFNFKALLSSLEAKTTNVRNYLDQLRSSTGGTVDLGLMFAMQFSMQLLSQYTETASNTLTAANTEMINMAKAVKGQ